MDVTLHRCRLHEAAPDLLEALEALQNAVSAFGELATMADSGRTPHQIGCAAVRFERNARAAFDEAEAAINRAGG